MANRKLQGEIDRVLKKVEDGVSIFEQIWDKVYSALSTAQKEKYEGDLKKEIKKLQRLRDQIKTWQGDSQIKDKSKLDSYRKLIEEKMERFKVCEKETKTKAFSKEGLAQDRTDPNQKAKDNVADWVRESISKLTEQCEEMEAGIETLNSGKRRKRNNDEHPRVTDLKEHISRHQHHMEMLEKVLRAVDNEAVSPAEATDLKDYVDDYIERNQEADFVEDLEMYDALNLEAVPVPVVVTTTGKKGSKSTTGDDDDVSSIATAVPVPSSTKKGPSSPRITKAGRVERHGSSKSSLSTRTVSPKNTRRGGNGAANHHTNTTSSSSTTVLTISGNNEQNNVSATSPRKVATSSNASSGTGKDVNMNTTLSTSSSTSSSSSATTSMTGTGTGSGSYSIAAMATSTTSTGSHNSSHNSISSATGSATAPLLSNVVRTNAGGGSTTINTPTTTTAKNNDGSGRLVTCNMTSRRDQTTLSTKIINTGNNTSNAGTSSGVVNVTTDVENGNFNSGVVVVGANGSVSVNVNGARSIRDGSVGNMFPPVAASATTTVPASANVAISTATTVATDDESGDAKTVIRKDMTPAKTAKSLLLNELGSCSSSGLEGCEENLTTTSTPGGMSKLDSDLAVLEGALQYMPEARSDTTKPSTTSRTQQTTKSDQIRHSPPATPIIPPTSTTTTTTHISSPRNPMEVPSSFPSVPAPVFDSREVFQQFDPDTLFFIFYYQQGTYQQYLAASELKRQGWRFHKKYLTWFQRHDEPKISTDEYETGTFIYFDYANVIKDGQGSGWCQRIKSEFRFEYRFLEDEL